MNVVRPFRGVSADDRRSQRRASLLDAGLDEVGDKGVAKLTMTGVCKRAGLTERYFYESFPNRDALVEALFDALFEEYFNNLVQAVADGSSDFLSRARLAVGTFVDIVTDDPRKARLYVETVGHDAVRERRMNAIRVSAEFGAEQAALAFGMRGKKQRARLLLVILVISAGQLESVVAWMNGDIPLSRDEYVEASARLFVSAAESARTASGS